MLSSNSRVVPLIYVLICLFYGTSYAENYPPEMARHFSTESGVIKRRGVGASAYDIALFSPEVLRNIGGVGAQANQLTYADGSDARVDIELRFEGRYPGHIVIHHGETESTYEIEYSDLVPLSLFVNSDGTSLYTLWDENTLPDNFTRDAGFISHEIDGYIALEFSGTRFEDALYYVDTCSICLGPDDDARAEKLSSLMSNTKYPLIDEYSLELINSSYINADVSVTFEITEAGQSLLVQGGIMRYFPQASNSNNSSIISIELVAPFVMPDDLPEADVEDRRRLSDAYFLFETLALLRAAKTHSPKSWTQFMYSLSSPSLVEFHAEPWQRYFRSVCTVYPEDAFCLRNREK